MSSIADVCDMDCIKSFSPLTFDMSGTLVTGVQALLRRVLYRWCTRLGRLGYAPTVGVLVPLLDADGTTFSPSDLAGLGASLELQAKEEAFVSSAVVIATLSDSGDLRIGGKIGFKDGRVEQLELAGDAARAVLLKLGSERA